MGLAESPLLLMVAPNGARRTKADHPALPLSPAELAREVGACREAGATLLHLHVRDGQGRHSLGPELYGAAIAAVRREVGDGMVVQVTTEAVGVYAPEQQMATVRALRPEAVSLALRELIPDPAEPGPAADFLRWLRRERIAPHFILYTPEEVAAFQDLRRRGVIPQACPFLLFVLGRYVDPVEVRPRDLLPFLAVHGDGDAAPWSVCAFGPAEAACALAAAALGGHVRVGFENNLHLSDGRLAPNNAALADQIRRGADLLGRPLATIDQTRALLAETAT